MPISEKEMSDLVLDVLAWCRKEDCADVLDDVVHTMHSTRATSINNEGTRSQVEWLINQGLTVKGVKDCIKEEINEGYKGV